MHSGRSGGLVRMHPLWGQCFPCGVLVALFSILFSGEVAGKALEDGLGTWPPAAHMGNQNGIPGSWLPPDCCGHLGSVTGGDQLRSGHERWEKFTRLEYREE